MHILFVLLIFLLLFVLFAAVGALVFFVRLIGGFANLRKLFSVFRRKPHYGVRNAYSSESEPETRQKRRTPVFDKSSAQEVDYEDVK
ncbi:MAG: hypothetical protein J6Y79_00745 [Paludibacteraceae bacterium]|nr:hypothetical protein [Paludibacteraceae bacterium]